MDWLGLELRLSRDPQVDLLVHAHTARQLTHLAALDHDGDWACAARLAARAVVLPEIRPDLRPALWLEFDLTGAADVPPGVFVTISPETGHQREPSRVTAETISEVLDVLALSDREAVLALTPLLRSHLRIRSLGFFPGREMSMVRVFCETSAVRGDLSSALAACGWPGSIAAVEPWVRAARRLGAEIHLDLDLVGATMAPGVGVEMSFNSSPPSQRPAKWRATFAVLQRTGVCLAAKGSALSDVDSSPSGAHGWQALNHVKVSVDAAGGSGAKAYFASRTNVTFRQW